MQRSKTLLAVVLLVSMSAVPAIAAQEETRHLDADTEGTAEDTSTGETFDATVNVTGDVTVRESGEGVDETAESTGLDVYANVTIDGTTYEVPVLVTGEGTSMEQAGFTAAEGWRLSVQGTELYDSGSEDRSTDGDDRDGSNADTDRATFWGNFTLVGTPDSGFQAYGNGTLTVVDANGTTTYALTYQGEATFE